MSAPDDLAPALERALVTRQAERLPSLAAAVVREGEVIWSGAVGLADCEAEIEATPEVQYRVGSITKTFTAVAVMQMRDAGKLDLDDRLEQHVPGLGNGSPTLRRMLAHTSGLQREAGEMFVTGKAPPIEQVLAAMDEYEQVLPEARAHHYSNLGYALLGEVVARASGVPYTEYVDREIIAPLGLQRTSWYEQEPRALAYLVDEFAGTASREPHSDMAGVAAMGQLWSTVGDLSRWGAFLVDGREGLLDPATAEEMWAPQVMMNPDEWTAGWGLGLELVNANGRIFGGHGGAMPGFLAGLYVNRTSRVGAAVLTNSGTRAPTREIALELAGIALEGWPAGIEPWIPEHAPPPEVAAILGRWWSEGNEFVFAWKGGQLVAEIPGAPPRVKPSVFEPLAGGGWRVESGRERGERLRVEGDRMIWAGYAFTRQQETTFP
ncbi:MAG TPA: serine hydrolase domain-containing protein [Gaiellaceae bacterium]|nr:serine hydrolase domain-containing protein [Gaiellaceae bacterium]